MTNKIKITSKFLHVFLTILAAAIMVNLTIVFIFTLSGNSESLTIERSQASFPLFDYEINDTTESERAQFLDNTISMAIGTTNAIIQVAIYLIASSIFKDISLEKSPFCKLQVQRLKRIAWLFIGFFLVPIVLDNILHWIMIRENYFRFTLDAAEIMTAAVFYALAEIVAYGSVLQRQADETL